jgi:hypothetical protein
MFLPVIFFNRYRLWIPARLELDLGYYAATTRQTTFLGVAARAATR